MASARKIVGGESFTFVWKVNGKIGELRGLEKLRQKLESAAKIQKNTDLASASDNRFTAIYWQNFLEKLAEGANAQRLQVGNQWQFTRPADALSFQPLTVSRTATKVSANAATLRDVAVFNVDTTPQKSQNFRDTAIRLEAGLAPKLELRIGRNDAMARPRHDLWRLEARRTFVAFRHANDFA